MKANIDLFTQFHREYELLRRENELKSSPKLSPQGPLNDEDFDVSIGDIPIEIKLPVLPVLPKPVQRPKKNQDSNPLW